MNGLFRSAKRTLSLGLAAALLLVGVVVAKGIHPETLVAFGSLNRDDSETLLASDMKEPQPPEHFAQADSETRLDVATGIRSALSGTRRSSVIARRSRPDRSDGPAAVEAQSNEFNNSLPPFPTAADEGAMDSAAMDSELDETASSVPPVTDAGPVFELPPTPDTEPPPGTEVVIATPETATTAVAPPTPAMEEALPGAVAPMNPQVQSSSTVPDANFAAQIAAMQEQLNKLAAQQEQSQSQQSWLESNQLLHRRELEKKLDGIESALRLLQTQSEQQGTQPRNGRTASRSSIIRQDKAGAGRSPVMGVTSAVRNALESLGDQSNVNLTLSINVEGDVEMNLKDDGASTATGDVPAQPGYYQVEKNGRKYYVAPTVPRVYQRDEFLPPIVKTPQEGTQQR